MHVHDRKNLLVCKWQLLAMKRSIARLAAPDNSFQIFSTRILSYGIGSTVKIVYKLASMIANVEVTKFMR